MDLRCKLNNSLTYKADRSNENMYNLTLASTVECKVIVDVNFFPRFEGNKDLHKLFAHSIDDGGVLDYQ